MVGGVERDAVDVATSFNAGLLDTLLDRVVARLTNALKVVRVEEQRFIAAMRLDVIADSGRNLTTGAGAEDAKGLTPQLFKAESLPLCAVVKLNSWFHDVMIKPVMAICFKARPFTTLWAKK